MIGTTTMHHAKSLSSAAGVQAAPLFTISSSHKMMVARSTPPHAAAGRSAAALTQRCRFSSGPEQLSSSTSSSGLAPLSQPQAQQRRGLSTIRLLSDAVAIQAESQRFERFAGRSAMIGVLVAVCAELLTEQTIFNHFSPETLAGLGGLFTGVVSLAAVAAAANQRRTGLELLEAVTTSLTANQRSAASVTGRQVDTAVDSVLNKVFDQGVIGAILAGEDDANI